MRDVIHHIYTSKNGLAMQVSDTGEKIISFPYPKELIKLRARLRLCKPTYRSTKTTHCD